MIISYRPLHILVLTITVPLSFYYFVLMISDMHGRLQRQMDTFSQQELELFERSIQLAERKPAEDDVIVTVPTTISWDDLVDEAMLKPILDLDGPKKWLKLQATNLMSSERILKKRSLNDVETSSVYSNRTTLRYNLMDENFKSNRNPISDNCTVEYINKNRLQQDHPCVIDVIQRLYLHQPSPLPNISHKMNHPDETINFDKQSIQIHSILRILHNQVQSNGFFVECCGSDDIEFLSTTFYMKNILRWQGLIIQASQQTHRKLLSRNQVYSLPVCLSPEPFPVKVTYNVKNKSEVYTIQCFPLYSILLAANRTNIDLIRLSARRLELKILKTIPWDKVNVKILSVKWDHVPADEVAAIDRFMKECGFTKYRQVSAVNHNNKVNNYINNNFLKSLRLQSL